MLLKRKSILRDGKSSGFICLILLFLIPLFFSFYILFSGTVLSSTRDLNIRSTCLLYQNKLFSQQKVRLKILLQLNPKALKLRAEKKHLEQRRNSALLSGQEGLAAYLEIQLIKNQAKRLKLENRQKNLIEMANEEFKRGDQVLKNQLGKKEKKYVQQGQDSFKINFYRTGSKIPQLAVIRDSPDFAPIYELSLNFETDQAWHYKWKSQFKTERVLKHFLPFNIEAERTCITTLRKDDFEIIVVDKS